MNGKQKQMKKFCCVVDLYGAIILLVVCSESTHGQTCNGGTNVTAISSAWKYVTSSNYPNPYQNNENCIWEIQASVGYKVVISIVDSDIQCPEDQLIIYDGSNTDPVLVNACDSNTESTFISSRSWVKVSFTTDSSITKPGFQIRYTAIDQSYTSCAWLPNNHHILVASEKVQYFSSKGYPIAYQQSLEEEWLIIKPNSTVPLGIRVKDSQLENGKNCRFDVVSIYNDPCPFKEELGEFCGSSTPSYTATGSMYVLIRFSSDGNQEFRGFKVEYFLGEAKGEDDSTGHVRNILIGVFSSILIMALILATARLITKNCKQTRSIRPKPTRNRRFSIVASSSRPLIGQQTTTQPRARLVATLGSSSDRISTLTPVSSATDIYSVSGNMNNRRLGRHLVEINTNSYGTQQTSEQPSVPCPPAYNTLYGDNLNTNFSVPPSEHLYIAQSEQFTPPVVPMSPPPPYPGIASPTNTNTAATTRQSGKPVTRIQTVNTVSTGTANNELKESETDNVNSQNN